MAKTYTVMKDGETIKELKTLAAAKKLADAEDAEVFCEGLCVYAPDPPVAEDEETTDGLVTEAATETTAPVESADAAETSASVESADAVADEKAEKVEKLEKPEKPEKAEKLEKPEKAEPTEKTSTKYTLLRKMNVRREPSLKAEKLKVLDTGAVVEVQDIRNDWLCLTNGSFILFEGGKNARKV